MPSSHALDHSFNRYNCFIHPIDRFSAPHHTIPKRVVSVLSCSLRDKYGNVFSIKLGSHKFVMASSSEAVQEMLVKKSGDYAGRQQTYFVEKLTLGKKASFCKSLRTTLNAFEFVTL